MLLLAPAQEFALCGDLFEDLKKGGGQMKEKYAARDVIVPFLSALSYLHAQVGTGTGTGRGKLRWSQGQGHAQEGRCRFRCTGRGRGRCTGRARPGGEVQDQVHKEGQRQGHAQVGKIVLLQAGSWAVPAVR